MQLHTPLPRLLPPLLLILLWPQGNMVQYTRHPILISFLSPGRRLINIIRLKRYIKPIILHREIETRGTLPPFQQRQRSKRVRVIHQIPCAPEPYYRNSDKQVGCPLEDDTRPSPRGRGGGAG